MKQRFLNLFDQSRKKKGILLLALILASAVFTGIFVSCSKLDDFGKIAGRLSVKQFSQNSIDKFFIFTSSNKPTSEPDILNVPYSTETANEHLNNDASYLGYRIQIHGVNTLQNGKKVTSTPLPGKLLEIKDVTFKTFSGKMQLSEVEKDGDTFYQYTYYVSDDKNDVMISYYSSVNNATEKEHIDEKMSKLQVALPQDKIYDNFVFMTFDLGSSPQSKTPQLFTYCYSVPDDWDWLNDSIIKSDRGDEKAPVSAGTLGAFPYSKVDSFYPPEITLLHEEKIEHDTFSVTLKSTEIDIPSGGKTYRYIGEVAGDNEKFHNFKATFSITSKKEIDNFSEDILKNMIVINNVSMISTLTNTK